MRTCTEHNTAEHNTAEHNTAEHNTAERGTIMSSGLGAVIDVVVPIVRRDR